MLFENFEKPDELAKRWRVPLSWIYSKTREKGPNAIPRIKLGKYIRFKPEEVDLWLRKCNS
jgi:predicted DNA-binding transcriptional regulator AlpA